MGPCIDLGMLIIALWFVQPLLQYTKAKSSWEGSGRGMNML